MSDSKTLHLTIQIRIEVEEATDDDRWIFDPETDLEWPESS